MRKLMWFTIGFAAVCALNAYCDLPWLLYVSVAVAVLGIAGCIALKSRVWIKIICLILSGCAVGCGWFAVYNGVYLVNSRLADGQTLNTVIHVTDYSYETDYGCASVGYVEFDGKAYLVRFYLNKRTQLEPGDTVEGKFRFRFTTAGGKEEPTYHRGEGIFLLLYPSEGVRVAESTSAPWYGYPAIWRQKLLCIIQEVFPEDASGFAQALLLGSRDGLDYQTQTALSVSGIRHIIAVSGLHVSILSGLLYMLTFRKRYLSFLVGAPALILFAAMVGFTPSITRACIMHILLLLAQLADREYDAPTELAFSVLVMLLCNPLTVTSISFQLSVSCMIGIFLFSGKIRAWLMDQKRLGPAKGKGLIPRAKRWFSSSVSITLGAMITTTPLVAYYFGVVSLVSVITNLLTLWVITYLFYGIVITCGMYLISAAAASVFGWLFAWLIRYVLTVSNFLSQLPFAAVYTESIYIVLWLICSYILLFAYLLSCKKYPAIFTCCVAITLCFAVAASWSEPLLYKTYVTVLDVGQGQCILLQCGGKTFMVDCGGDDAQSAADKAAHTLLSRGLSRLDGIILTHYDEDHAGGVKYLLSRIDTDLILMPDILDEAGIGADLAERTDAPANLVSEDLEITFDDGKLTVFGPDDHNSGNESSLCVLLQTENCDILITGDRGELGEMVLVRDAKLPELELLIAGHHGAATSTTDLLLKECRPKTVAISVGTNNRYGHPAQSVLDRLSDYGCEVYRTDIHGTIIYRR